MNEDQELCACGQPLHYSDPGTREHMERLCRELGATMKVMCSEGTWLVPRHYIALHGLKAWEIPELAKRFGWKKVKE